MDPTSTTTPGTRVARKRAGGKTGGKPPAIREYTTTKAGRELVRRAGELARDQKIATAELLTRILEPTINKLWEEYLAREAAKVAAATSEAKTD